MLGKAKSVLELSPISDVRSSTEFLYSPGQHTALLSSKDAEQSCAADKAESQPFFDAVLRSSCSASMKVGPRSGAGTLALLR